MAKDFIVTFSSITDKNGTPRAKGEKVNKSELNNVERLLELRAVVEAEETPKATEPAKPTGQAAADTAK